MEQVHGIDVSWLHHNQREHDKLKRPNSTKQTPTSSTASTPPKTPQSQPQHALVPPPDSSAPHLPKQETSLKPIPGAPRSQPEQRNIQTDVATPLAQQSAAQDFTNTSGAPPPVAANPKRRSLLSRASSSGRSNSLGSSPDDRSSKRLSWMASLSQKFSSSQSHVPTISTVQTPTDQSAAQQTTKSTPNAAAPQYSSSAPQPSSLPNAANIKSEDFAPSSHPSLSQSPGRTSGSFLSSALRKLNPNVPPPDTRGPPSPTDLPPRQILNVDRNRVRCKVKELDSARLKRVAFNVDVEIAGASVYTSDEDASPIDAATKEHDKKLMAISEGNALKSPQMPSPQDDEPTGQQTVSTHEKLLAPPPLNTGRGKERHDSFTSVSSADEPDDNDWDLSLWSSATRRPSQDSQLDPEGRAKRKAMREEKRRLKLEAAAAGQPISPITPTISISEVPQLKAPPKPNERPTTDPVRMYRRCCQLREAPVLKRISEQLSNSQTCALEIETNIVGSLDLRGSRMQLSDIICLGDWLAIVPVRKLLLDNANLSDAGLRCILAGLLAAKPPDIAQKRRGKSSPNRAREAYKHRSTGVVERLSLRNNPKITKEGWKDLCTFISMAKSLKAIDMSIIPFPHPRPPKTSGTDTGTESDASFRHENIAELMQKALAARAPHHHLEELIIGDCNLFPKDVNCIVQGAISCKLRRLGLARNHLNHEAVQYVADYIRSGICWGLDIGGNDLADAIPILTDAMSDPECPLWAFSVARCKLNVDNIGMLLSALSKLKNLRFLDLSHNTELFSTPPPNALGCLRKYLPRMHMIRRLHLTDVDLTPRQAIGLAEIFPEMRNINHVNMLGNAQLKALGSATDPAAQEDACAVYASLMVAAKVSKTILAIDLEPPTDQTSDIVRALSKQTLAYCLRNMDRFTSSNAIKFDDPAGVIPDAIDPDKEVHVPASLIHLVGPAEASHQVEPPDHEAHPSSDYIVSGTGVVKALSYVLGASGEKRSETGTTSPFAASAAASNRRETTKVKDMSKDMLASARKIRARLQPALTKEFQDGNDMDYRRLQFLDHTLHGMIERFEAEYPECRLHKNPPMTPAGSTTFPQDKLPSHFKDSSESADEATGSNAGEDEDDEEDGKWPAKGKMSPEEDSALDFYKAPGARRASETSLAGRALAEEEGKMHRFGQSVRRNVLPPSGMDDYLHGTKAEDTEDEHMSMLRARMESLEGDAIRHKVVRQGLEATVRELYNEREELKKVSSRG